MVHLTDMVTVADTTEDIIAEAMGIMETTVTEIMVHTNKYLNNVLHRNNKEKLTKTGRKPGRKFWVTKSLNKIPVSTGIFYLT